MGHVTLSSACSELVEESKGRRTPDYLFLALNKKTKSKFELEIVGLVRQKRNENKLTQENIAMYLNVTGIYWAN